MSEQRFIVNGINNDKIELVSNYDVRKLNRLIEAEKALINSEWKEKIKQAREEMKECSYRLSCFNEDVFDEDERVVDLDNVLIILDKLIESEEK